MNEILLTGLAVAEIVMIVLDIIEKVKDYRIKKVEKEMAKAYKPPEIAITNPKIIPLRAEMAFLPHEATSEQQVRTELGKMLLYLINEKDLINFHVFEDPTTN